MARFKIVILAPAWQELEEIADYHLATAGQIFAKKIADKILDALSRLSEFPLSCPYAPDIELKEQGYRMLVCDQYLLFYRLIDSTVCVYHIAHGAAEYGKLDY